MDFSIVFVTAFEFENASMQSTKFNRLFVPQNFECNISQRQHHSNEKQAAEVSRFSFAFAIFTVYRRKVQSRKRAGCDGVKCTQVCGIHSKMGGMQKTRERANRNDLFLSSHCHANKLTFSRKISQIKLYMALWL